MRLIGISGSLRQGSYNSAILGALQGWAKAPVEFERAFLDDIPLYNPDLESLPESVKLFKDLVAKADGVLIVTPEYNYGIPGVLKNALDWASRPAYRSVFARKKVGLLGASVGPVGTARAQGQLKQVLLGMVAHVFPAPEMAIGSVAQKLDSGGALTDEVTERALRGFLQDFVEWVSAR